LHRAHGPNVLHLVRHSKPASGAGCSAHRLTPRRHLQSADPFDEP
jgi:hypothetical protein